VFYPLSANDVHARHDTLSLAAAVVWVTGKIMPLFLKRESAKFCKTLHFYDFLLDTYIYIYLFFFIENAIAVLSPLNGLGPACYMRYKSFNTGQGMYKSFNIGQLTLTNPTHPLVNVA